MWKLHPREWRTDIKTRWLGFCDEKGCYNKCYSEGIRFCIVHKYAIDAAEIRRKRPIKVPGRPL